MDRRITSDPAGRASMLIVNIQWLREELGFIGVSLIARLVSPCTSHKQRERGCERRQTTCAVGGSARRHPPARATDQKEQVERLLLVVDAVHGQVAQVHRALLVLHQRHLAAGRRAA